MRPSQIGGDTRFPSLELGCDESRTVGNCDSGYSCAYTNSLSWRSPTSPMPPETNPRLAFERLFGGMDAGLDPATRALRRRSRRSILDLVTERTVSLVSTLGASDRHKVDEYLTSVREIERRIEIAEHDTREVTPDFEMPSGVPVLFADYASLMFDMQAIAFQADLTRVSTMMLGREGSLRTYPEIGVPDPHHPLTHHRDNPEWIEKVTKVNVFHMELFAKFIARLAAMPEGDGTVLDNTMVVYGSGISDGNKHTHENLPVVVAGHAGGLVGGRHLVFDDNTPMTNFYLTRAQPGRRARRDDRRQHRPADARPKRGWMPRGPRKPRRLGEEAKARSARARCPRLQRSGRPSLGRPTPAPTSAPGSAATGGSTPCRSS